MYNRVVWLHRVLWFCFSKSVLVNRVLWYRKPGALGEPGGLEIERGALVRKRGGLGMSRVVWRIKSGGLVIFKTRWFGFLNWVFWVSLPVSPCMYIYMHVHTCFNPGTKPGTDILLIQNFLSDLEK